MKLPIYLDNAATTPIDPRVVAARQACLGQEGTFGNPASSTHLYGYMAKEKVDAAREQVARLIQAMPEEIIWTSGATEANNLAIKGYAAANAYKGKHIITCKTEHKAVLDVCAYLETQGFTVTYLPVLSSGLIDLNELKKALRAETMLVSIMHVNNEIGVIQPIAEIARIVHEHKAILHVDAAQSAGKIPVDVKTLGADLLSLSAHKMYGPKGSGALYVRANPAIKLTPLIHGGGHERGLRSGTLATHQIVGLGRACEIATLEMRAEAERIRDLKEYLWQGISSLKEVYRNGDAVQSVPGILSVSFAGCDGEALLMALQGVAVSAGSACTSATMTVSHVLRGLGLDMLRAQSTLRFSLGRFTTRRDIEETIMLIRTQVEQLRAFAP